MEFKVGDKAKVVDKESLFYNKTVELIKVDNEAYIFYYEPKKIKLVVHKDAIQNTIEWESSPDKGETNIDKLLGQNGELVEERKKQVLAGALGIVQHYCEETPNKMEVVAALFGKRLGEKFTVQDKYFDYAGMIFDVSGLRNSETIKRNDEMTVCEAELLCGLLTGEAVIGGDK